MWQLTIEIRSILYVFLILPTLFLNACNLHPLEKARQEIPIGTTREDAIEILSQESWYHQPCPNRVTIDDLFFFNSHDYEEADIVIVRSEPDGNIFKVYQIGSFEPYAWQTAYRDCIQLDRFKSE